MYDAPKYNIVHQKRLFKLSIFGWNRLSSLMVISSKNKISYQNKNGGDTRKSLKE